MHVCNASPFCWPPLRFLDKAAIVCDSSSPHGSRLVSLTEVEETKAFLGTLPIFFVLCIGTMVRRACGASV